MQGQLKLLELATEQDISGPYAEITEAIGFENTIKFIRHFEGQTVYVPAVRTVVQTVRNRLIRQEFNGRNYRELGQKYGLSVVRIRQIVHAKKEN